MWDSRSLYIYFPRSFLALYSSLASGRDSWKRVKGFPGGLREESRVESGVGCGFSNSSSYFLSLGCALKPLSQCDLTINIYFSAKYITAIHSKKSGEKKSSFTKGHSKPCPYIYVGAGLVRVSRAVQPAALELQQGRNFPNEVYR